MLLTASWLIPLSSRPFEKATIRIERDIITAIDRQNRLSKQNHDQVIDLKNTILLPGLINTHTHLEHSQATKFDHPPRFTEWVREMKGRTQGSPLRSGIRRLVQTGTTTIADHRHPETDVVAIHELPLRCVAFWEVLGADKTRARQCLLKAQERVTREGGFVSPHSLYGVHREILNEMFSVRGGRGGRTPPLRSIHLLESADEDEFFRKRSGPLADYVVERGGGLDFPSTSPVEWIVGAGFSRPEWMSIEGARTATLLVHCNYLTDAEMDILQKYDVTIVHCPGSHQYFGHKRFPLEELQKRKIRITLGTDSLASNDDLSMFREMRLLKETYPFLSAKEIVTIATLNGARALGLDHEIGSIEVGKKADLIAVPITDPSRDPYENVLMAEKVEFSVMDGNIIEI